jgi:WD40 repeat protein
MNDAVGPSGVPFVGLRPFDTSDAKWFYGRDRETTALTRKLLGSRFTAVVGPSGSGKSSIVRAGVVPLLQVDGWAEVVTKPGSAPLARLALALSGAASSERLAEARRFRFDAMLRASAFGLADIAETLRPDAPRLLLVVDQFEELFRYGEESSGAARAAMREEARAFVELLLAAGKREGGRMHVCITMRSDYFGNCSAYVGLAEAVSASQFLVPLPLRGQMEEAIRKPVAQAGGSIEEALIQRLLVDVVEEFDQLPLLQHTLRRLWERASGSPRTMHEADYVAVGRIAGSIDRKAEGVLKALTEKNPMDRITLERVMKALTDLDERDRATRRPQKLSELRDLVTDSLGTDPEVAKASLTRALDTLKAEDTSFLQFGEGDDPEIDIGHEALIRSWTRLADQKLDFSEGWLREERRDGEKWRGYVRCASEGLQFARNDQRTLPEWLRERSLGEIWSRRYGNQWREVAELRARSRRSTNLKSAVASVGVLVLLAGGGWGVGWPVYKYYSGQSAHNARLNALSLAGHARAAAKDGDSRLAALLALDALRAITDVKDDQNLPQLESALFDALARPIQTGRLPFNARAPTAMFSPDGRLIAAISLDNKLHLWSTETLKPLHLDETPLPVRSEVRSVRFSPDGRFIAADSSDGKLHVWSTETLQPLHLDETPLRSSVTFSPDGRLIAAVSRDGKLHVWSTETLQPLHLDDAGTKQAVASAMFAPDLSGIILVTMSRNKYSFRLWNTVTDKPIGDAIIDNPCKSIPAFSSNGSQIVASIYVPPLKGSSRPKDAGETGRASRAEDTLGLCRWDAKTGALIQSPKEPFLVGVRMVKGSPDGNHFISLSDLEKNSLRLWDGSGNLIGRLEKHTEPVTSATFSPDGSRIVSTSEDNTLRLWDANTGEAIGLLQGHTASVKIATFSPDGLRIVSASNDNTLRLWDAITFQPIGPPIRGHLKSVSDVSFSHDGRHVISTSDDESVRVWDVGGFASKLLGLPFQGHTDTVQTVAFSSDGQRVVSGSSDQTLRLWDAATGRPIGQPLRGHTGSVYSVAFSPDGKRIVSTSADQTLRLWDATNGKPIGEPLVGHDDVVYSATFSPDGRQIVSASADNSLRLWDAMTGRAIGEPLRGHTSAVISADFSPDGLRIVSASDDRTVRLWDARTAQPIGEPLQGHDDKVRSATFSPDGDRIVSASADRTLRLWDAKTGRAIGEPLKGHTDSVNTVAFSPYGRQIVSTSEDGTLRLWDAATGQPLGEPLQGHAAQVASAVFSPDGRSIVSGSVDRTIRIWDVRTRESRAWPLASHTDAVTSAAFSPDGKRIVSASSDRTLRLWDAMNGQPIGDPLQGHKDEVTSVAFSPDGKRIVSASADRTLRLWDAANGKPIGDPLRGHSNIVYSAAFSPDGKHIVSASADKTVRLWDATNGQPIGDPLLGHEKDVTSAAFSPDGKRIVSTSADHTLRLWDATNGKQIGGPLQGHGGEVTSAAFSRDGKSIVSASVDQTLRLWDATTGKPIEHHPLLKGHADRVNNVAFSPDGRFIVSASNDKTLRLWDAKTGLPIGAPLPGHSQPVRSAAFSPDGSHIVSASADATLRLWTLDFPVSRPLAEAKADRLCPLNEDEREELGLVDPIAPEHLPAPGDQLSACVDEPVTAAGR